jgi:hypothetical protein
MPAGPMFPCSPFWPGEPLTEKDKVSEYVSTRHYSAVMFTYFHKMENISRMIVPNSNLRPFTKGIFPLTKPFWANLASKSFPKVLKRPNIFYIQNSRN